MNHEKRRSLLCVVAAALLTLVACGADEDGAERAEQSDRAREAVVLLSSGFAGSWPTGLDPATNLTARANLSLMNAIYGGLFQLTADPDGGNAEVVGFLAAGYEIEDEGRTVMIRLREGVTFSDGTPFDAEAVRFNIERNLGSSCTCAPTGWPWAEKDRVTTSGDHIVRLHFERPYAPVINSFPAANVNWIASPTALEKMGEEQFSIKPVGAGPFKVVSNQLSSELVLERNPLYWQHDRPYLDRLVFKSIGSEQAALQALLAGDAQAFEGMTSVPLIRQAQKHDEVTVAQQPGVSPYLVQLNTARPPFDDQRAREAIYHATDVESIRRGLFENRYPASQSFTAPAGLFHHESVSGYRKYDPDRARSIVEEVGEIKVTLGTIQSFVSEQVVTALQSQWRNVGIDVSIETYELAGLIRKFQTGDWHAMLQTAGSFDPESGTGVSFRFRSGRPFTGVWDQELDRMLMEAARTFDADERDALYVEAAEYISDHAYAPFLFAYAPAQLTVEGLSGPGLTTKIPPIVINPAVLWQDVGYERP